MPTTRLPATGGPKLNDVGPRPLSGKTAVTMLIILIINDDNDNDVIT